MIPKRWVEAYLRFLLRNQLAVALVVAVMTVFFAVQAALPYMREGGRIVTIGSVVAERTGFAGSSVYSATKGAMAAMVRGLARDLGPRGIGIANIQPGPTGTDMTPADGPVAQKLKPLIPLGRIGSDFEGTSRLVQGLEDVSTFPALFAELARRGWSEAELALLAGGNILRVMREAEAVAGRNS